MPCSGVQMGSASFDAVDEIFQQVEAIIPAGRPVYRIHRRVSLLVKQGDLPVVELRGGAAFAAEQVDEDPIPLHVGGPADIQRQGGPPFKPDHRHGQIFNVEDPPLVDRAVAGQPLFPRTEYPIGSAEDGPGLGEAHQPQGQVQHVDADIDQGTAAGPLHRRKPAPPAGNAVSANPPRLCMVNLA